MRQRGIAELEGEGEAIAVTGPVLRVGHEIVAGTSTWYVQVRPADGDAGAAQLFRLAAELSVKAPLPRAGDRVVVEALDTGEPVLDADCFDNLEILQDPG